MSLQSHGAHGANGGGTASEIARLGPWFHNLRLPGGVTTAPDHPLGDFPSYKWEQIAPVLPDDLRGARALDIGCNAGFYTFELARRGAHVLAIDHDPRYLDQARWAGRQLGLDHLVDLRRMDVYDLARLPGTFDLVLFMGVLYHPRHPLLALDLVAEHVGGTLVLQTLTLPDGEGHEGDEGHQAPPHVAFDQLHRLREPGWPTMAFVEHHLADDHTNWWVPSATAVEAMVRTTGLRVVARPGHEIWVCERERPTHHGPETDRATGRVPQP
jgi:tRNA (mo5U34)-methyltransferase